MKILSVVIPAYNAQDFLNKCIPSFLHDEVINLLDIIIVNDGSTDNTAQVAQTFCDKYPGSIRLISQENKGHGGALNTGCAAAKGKYLKVIDADDWVETDNLPIFIDKLRNCKSDVVLTHHYTRDISNGKVKKWMSYPSSFETEYTFDDIMLQWKNFDRSLTFHGITYKTEFYRQNSIQLSEKVFYEDHEYATFPCCMARSITPLDLFIYNYRIGDITQSVSDMNQLNRIGHTETVLMRIINEYHKVSNEISDSAKEYIAYKAQGLLLSYLTTVLLVNKNKHLGRECACKMMQIFAEKLPRSYQLAKNQYAIFLILNILHLSKSTFNRILNSKLYNKVRNNHNFD